MSATVTKLESVVTRDAPFVGLLPDGHHIVTLNYKTDSETKVKRPSESWIVPKLKMEVLSDSDKILSALSKWIDERQELALREVAAGDLDYLPMVSSVDLLCEEYTTDRRGNRTGLKQSQLMDWIANTLMPFVTKRIEANLVNATKDQKQNLVVSYTKKFRIAATRGNRSGGETLPDATLQDLQQRMERYEELKQSKDTEGNTVACMEYDALLARITEHRKAIAKSLLDVTTADF